MSEDGFDHATEISVSVGVPEAPNMKAERPQRRISRPGHCCRPVRAVLTTVDLDHEPLLQTGESTTRPISTWRRTCRQAGPAKLAEPAPDLHFLQRHTPAQLAGDPQGNAGRGTPAREVRLQFHRIEIRSFVAQGTALRH